MTYPFMNKAIATSLYQALTKDPFYITLEQKSSIDPARANNNFYWITRAKDLALILSCRFLKKLTTSELPPTLKLLPRKILDFTSAWDSMKPKPFMNLSQEQTIPL